MSILKVIMKQAALAGAVLLGNRIVTQAWDKVSGKKQADKPAAPVKARAKPGAKTAPKPKARAKAATVAKPKAATAAKSKTAAKPKATPKPKTSTKPKTATKPEVSAPAAKPEAPTS